MTKDVTIVTPPVRTRRHKVQRAVNKVALIFLILGPLVFMAAALGYKFGIFDLGFSLGTLSQKAGPLLLLAAALAGFIGLIMCFTVKPRRGLIISLLAIAVPAVGLIKAKGVGDKVAALPFIHDVTTDTQDPPLFTDAVMSERAKVEGVNTVDYVGKKDLRDKKLVSVLQVESYPEIRPVILSGDAASAFASAKKAVKTLGWELMSENEMEGIIEATDTTAWYGFKDDIVIRVRPSQGGGSVVDIRSVSRIGQSDIGANAARIEKFIDIIQP